MTHGLKGQISILQEKHSIVNILNIRMPFIYLVDKDIQLQD